MTTDAICEERGSDWSHRVSVVATTRWLQCDQTLPLSAKGVACKTMSYVENLALPHTHTSTYVDGTFVSLHLSFHPSQWPATSLSTAFPVRTHSKRDNYVNHSIIFQPKFEPVYPLTA